MLHPPALGIHGNSHLIMQDENNLQIADLILEWVVSDALRTGYRLIDTACTVPGWRRLERRWRPS